MKSNFPRRIRYFFIGTLFVSSLLSSLNAAPTIDELRQALGTPSDGGSGPSLWFQGANEPNHGNAGDQWVLTSWGQMTETRADFFGNTSGAFALEASAGRGAAISGTGGTTFAAGDSGTVVIIFETPADVDKLGSIMSRGVFSRTDPFEISIFNAQLRIARRVGEDKHTGVLAGMKPNTWYYLAVSWDLSASNDPIQYFLLDMEESLLYRGSLAATVVGDTAAPMIVAGRAQGDGVGPLFFGSYQDLAIYERAVSADAIMDQIDMFRGTESDEVRVQELLPDAYWVGQDRYNDPVLGNFRTDSEAFPEIDHDRFGSARLFEVGPDGERVMYVHSASFSDCATSLGWVVMTDEATPYFYSVRHDSMVQSPNFDVSEFWIYDFSVGDWFAYRCEAGE